MTTKSTSLSSKTIVTVPPASPSDSKVTFETAVAAIITKRATSLEKPVDAIEKTESFPPAEIISVVDYNRTHELSATGNVEKNSYGSYYDALESIHSITNDDVSYVVSKCLENDVSGEWKALRSSTEADVENSQKLLDFLSTYCVTLESAQQSLNFTRTDDLNLQSFGESYLNSKVTSYATKPENRVFSVDYILNETFESNSKALKKVLEVLKNNLTKEDQTSYQAIINSLSLKTIKDLNLVEEHWNSIDSVSDKEQDKLVACCEIISQIFSLSAGIQKFNGSGLSIKSNNKNDLGSIFEGTNLVARPGKTSGPDSVPYRRNSFVSISDMLALNLLQYDTIGGNISIPVEANDSSDGYSYFSGYSALIKDPILRGEFTFPDFKKFYDIFEKNRDNIESYLELFLGQCDPLNEITPAEICRIICKNFLDGLNYAEDSFITRLTLFLLKIAVNSPGNRQDIVRAIEVIRTNQIEVGTSTSDVIETTTTTSEGKEIDIGSKDTKTTTTRTEIKKSVKSKRIIEKYASSYSTTAIIGKLKYYFESKVTVDTSRLGDFFTPYLNSILKEDAEYSSFFNFILKAYDEIVKISTDSLPEDKEIVNKSGTTLYSNLDEFGLLVLIVECFSILASTINIQPTILSSTGALDLREDPTSSVPSLKEVEKSLQNFLNQLQTTELRSISSNDSYSRFINIAFSSLLDKQEKYQNSLAYLAAFSDGMKRSHENLVKTSGDILNNATNAQNLNTPDGRRVLANLSTQQVACRRSILERYTPEKEAGYLPRRTIYSDIESKILNILLSSSEFTDSKSENFRIVTCAAPIGSINNKIETIGEKTSTISSDGTVTGNQTGMLELMILRKDHELDDLIFKPKSYIFDPLLYVGPIAFEEIVIDDVISGDDIVLEICKNSTFSLHDLSGTRYLTYTDILNDLRYSSLKQEQIEDVLKNTMLSYLMETYTYKLSGAIFDENLNVELDSSLSEAGQSAISTISNLKLSDLVLPNASQINLMLDQDGEIDPLISVEGTTVGDRELMASLANSYLLRNDKLIDRLTKSNKFDRVFSVVVDPDDFEVDSDKTISQNGLAGRIMINRLRELNLLNNPFSFIVPSTTKELIVPRDPTTGGFSIGNLSCQFMPHTDSAPGEETTAFVSVTPAVDATVSTFGVI